MGHQTNGHLGRYRVSSDDARARLRAAADQLELGSLVRGVGLKVTIGALGAGLILGALPAARRAAKQGVQAVIQQVRMMRGRM